MLLPEQCYGYGDTVPRNGLPIRFVVNHVAVGNGSLYWWFIKSGLSTHFWVSKEGRIEQYVPLDQAAYGQGLTSSGSDFPPEYPGNGVDYNRMALSIEREGFEYETPTPAQWAAIIRLNRWLAQEYAIPMDGDHIVGHYRTDHATRANCPSIGASDYMERLVRDLNAA